jgi:glycosyltransferase involved in cell wall biosynthesis
MKVQTFEMPKTGTSKREADDAAHFHPDPIVCVSDLFWDEHWCSEQQLMSRLAKRGRVLYVERPVSLFSFFTKSSDAPVGRQMLRWLIGGIRHESSTLTILTPPPVLPLRYVGIVNVVNEWVRLRSIKRALKRLGAKRPVLWIYSPDAGRLVGKAGEALSLYYCADDWAAWGQWWNSACAVRARENELGAKVDLIVGTSTTIVKRWNESNEEAILVSNGADVTSFKEARNPGLSVPEDLRSIPEPRIGFVGFVDGRLDTKLYESLAALKPEWSFVIVGPFDEKKLDLSRLRHMSNVYFLGKRTLAELPAYLKGFSVCTIPYIRNRLSDSIFPLKLFEYLAAGRQVVATALPDLQPFTRYIRIADSPQAFLTALELSLSDPLDQPSDAFLDSNSWDAKAEFLWSKLVAELGQRSRDAQLRLVGN